MLSLTCNHFQSYDRPLKRHLQSGSIVTMALPHGYVSTFHMLRQLALQWFVISHSHTTEIDDVFAKTSVCFCLFLAKTLHSKLLVHLTNLVFT